MDLLVRGERSTERLAVSSSRSILSLAWLDDWCLSWIAAGLPGVRVCVRLWDGTSANLSASPPVATVTIHDRATLVGLALRPELTFGQAYADGRLSVAGDLTQLLESIDRAYATKCRPDLWRRALGGCSRAIDRDSARRNVHRHYDLGNDFYKLWLDEAMVYTCAYFERAGASLDEAQRAKLDYVCRKLDLRPGQHVIEAGCGWGALALHMAQHYGVIVRAYNISAEQLRYARDRAAREGLADRVTFVDGDFRSMTGRCDAFVSIGMLEHVGRGGYRVLGDVINRVLDPVTGRGLLHFIGRNFPRPFSSWIRRYVFPGAYAPALGEVLQGVFEPYDLSVIDVENLRRHYAKTVEHWLARFERAASHIAETFDDRFVRMWRLYLASAQASFAVGDLQLFQVTFSRSADNTAPWTRAGLYSGDPPAVV